MNLALVFGCWLAAAALLSWAVGSANPDAAPDDRPAGSPRT